MIRKVMAFGVALFLSLAWVGVFTWFALLHEHFYAIAANGVVVKASSFPLVEKWPQKFHSHLMYILLLATVFIDVLLSALHELASHKLYLVSAVKKPPSYGRLVLSMILVALGFMLAVSLYSSYKTTDQPDYLLPNAIFVAVALVKFVEYFKVDEVVDDISEGGSYA